MSETAEKITVKVKTENGNSRWNHLSIIKNRETKNVFLVFETEEDEIYIQYDTVAISVNGKFEEYELTHEEEEAIKSYISANYGTL